MVKDYKNHKEFFSLLGWYLASILAGLFLDFEIRKGEEPII